MLLESFHLGSFKGTSVKYLPILALVAVTITACAPAEITSPPVMIKPKNTASSSGIDVYARDRSHGNPAPAFRGQKTVQIRATGKNPDGSYGELSGAQCLVDAGVFSASIMTPANIIVPDYGASSPALFVRCKSGTQSGSVTVSAYNATNAQRQASAMGSGILGAIIIGAVAANRRNDAIDDFQYPPINVPMK